MLTVEAEFRLEAGDLDFAQVTRLVGVEPSHTCRAGQRRDGEPVMVDRWTLAVAGEPVWPGFSSGDPEVMDQLGVLWRRLEGPAVAIADFCHRSGARASFHVTADSTTEDRPLMWLPPDFCAFLARLGVEVEFVLRTRPGLEPPEDEDCPPAPKPLAGAADLVRLSDAQADRVVRTARPDTRKRSAPQLGPVRQTDTVTVMAGRTTTDDSEYEDRAALHRVLAGRLGTLETGITAWGAMLGEVDGSEYLYGDPAGRFGHVVSDCGPYVAVAVGASKLGLDIELSGRAFPPGLVGQLAVGERAYIQSAQSRVTGSVIPATAGDGTWAALVPEANRLAWEVRAKKQAYLIWLGEWPAGGMDSFDVTRPDRLEVRFWPLSWDEAPDLIGWLCLGDAGVTRVDSSWAGEDV
ncbi:MAG: DUF4279 domain-containing protein [Propionibacteriaceae bacterium]|nr:DUF4279 domain-containing protein [Propionibacteriaceae bacterium]